MTADLAANENGVGVGFFLEADFFTFEGLISTGTHVEDPDPTPVAKPMPWPHFRHMTLEDLESVYTYINTVADQTSHTFKEQQAASFYCEQTSDCDTGAGETCDLTNASPTIHECIGLACNPANNDANGGNSACRVCQVCNGNGTCGGALVPDGNCAL